ECGGRGEGRPLARVEGEREPGGRGDVRGGDRAGDALGRARVGVSSRQGSHQAVVALEELRRGPGFGGAVGEREVDAVLRQDGSARPVEDDAIAARAAARGHGDEGALLPRGKGAAVARGAARGLPVLPETLLDDLRRDEG